MKNDGYLSNLLILIMLAAAPLVYGIQQIAKRTEPTMCDRAKQYPASEIPSDVRNKCGIPEPRGRR